MKIFGNIGPAIRLANTVRIHKSDMKAIQEARAEGDTEKEINLIAYSTKIWVNEFIEAFDLDVNVKGRENIPDGPCVVISNHQAYADIIIIIKALEGKQVGFIAKENLTKVPYVGKWIEATRGIFIKRGNPRESLKSIREGVDYLKQGFSIAIFPEGTRSRSSEMAHFKSGSFKLATKAKVPILPITLNNSYKTFEEKGKFTGGVHMDVIIHPPIETKDLSRKEISELHGQVENIIRDSLEELKKDI